MPAEESEWTKASAFTRITYSPGSVKVAIVVDWPVSVGNPTFCGAKATGPGPAYQYQDTFMPGRSSPNLMGSLSCTASSVNQIFNSTGVPTVA